MHDILVGCNLGQVEGINPFPAQAPTQDEGHPFHNLVISNGALDLFLFLFFRPQRVPVPTVGLKLVSQNLKEYANPYLVKTYYLRDAFALAPCLSATFQPEYKHNQMNVPVYSASIQIDSLLQ